MAWTISVSLNEPAKGLDRINKAFSNSANPPPQFYDTLGVILTKLDRIDDAIRNLELAVKDRPTPLVYAHLARAYHRKKMTDKFRQNRDLAKKNGLTIDKIDKDERDELGKLIFGPDA
jgi:predicted Zn-dependent protease